MRKLDRNFWRKALRSLPAPVQARYAGYFQAAERWELALDEIIEWVSRVKARVSSRVAHA